MNHVFVAAETVVRVGIPNGDGSSQLALARNLARVGVAAPEPAIDEVITSDEMTASAWRLIEKRHPVDWESIGSGLRSLHRVEPKSVVPSGHPVADPRRLPWWDFDALLKACGPELDAAALLGMRRALARHEGWDDWTRRDLVLCHGDVHPGNVIGGPAGAVLVDWDLMCLAPPEWDLAPMSIWSRNWGGDALWYRDLESGYGTRLDRELIGALGDLRDLAATLMAVRAGRTDAGRAAEAERRLTFWRDGAGPRWTSA